MRVSEAFLLQIGIRLIRAGTSGSRLLGTFARFITHTVSEPTPRDWIVDHDSKILFRLLTHPKPKLEDIE